VFNSASRNPGIDLAQLIQMFGPQGGLGLPQAAGRQPGRINPAGMEKNADGTSSFPSAPPQLKAPGTPGMFAAGRQVAPVNSVAMPNAPMAQPRFSGFEPTPPGPPDQLFGTNPIGTPGIGDGLPGAIPMDRRVSQATAPRFFDKGGAWKPTLGILADAMSTLGGGKPTYGPAMLDQQKREQEQQRWQAEQDLTRQKFDWEKKKGMRPDIRAVGRSVVSVPFEGDPSVLYQAPSDGEQYAASLGLSEGDDGYADAVMDFTLRSNGPTAFGQRRRLEDQRYGNRVNLKGVPTYANLNSRAGGGRGNGGAPRPPASVSAAVAPLIAKLASGQPLSAGEQQALAYYNRGGRGGKPTLPISPGPAGPAPIPPRPAAPRLPIKQAGPVRVSTPEEARRLKPGTPFITPDGKQKVR
jgi:hypothetical protein